MKKLCLIIVCLCFGVSQAQNNITGTVVSKNNEPVPNAIISLLDSENKSFIKGELSNESGVFNIKDINNGTYLILVTSLGMEDYTSDLIIIVNDNKNLGEIIMVENSEVLDEVTLIIEKPIIQVMADRTVFNVANTVNAIGDSGFELLRKAPGIVIDNSDNIIVEGKAGVLIYIDGKPSVLRGSDLANFLKSLQATDIDSIEIITQPSSRYEAEGNAGIINIKLKLDKTIGTNGSMASSIVYGDFARISNSVSFNSRNVKTNIYSTYSNFYGKTTSFINMNRLQNETNFNSRTTGVDNKNINNFRLGLDFFANQKSTFGIIAIGNFNNLISNDDSKTTITPNGNNNPDEFLIAASATKNKTSNVHTNLNYKFKDTLGHILNIDLDYGKFLSDRTNSQPNQYFNGNQSELLRENITFFDTPIDISIISGQLDYEQKLLKGHFSLGIKYSKVKTNNSFDVYDRTNGNNDLDESQSNDFTYDEQINAGYINYSAKFKKINIQFGLRIENTLSDAHLKSQQEVSNDRVKRNYTNWFPSGGITYKANEKNSWALNYSRRIQRPNYQSLNPFQYRSINELSFIQGNPFLQPQYTDNIKLSHTYNNKLTTSLIFSSIKDFFAQITEAISENERTLIQRNVANQQILSLDINYPAKINDWWRVYFNIGAYRDSYNAINLDFVSLTQTSLDLYTQNTFKLPKELTAEVSGWYSSPSIWGGTYKIKSTGSLNIAIQKRFFDDKFTVRLGFNDLLFTSPWRGTTQFGDLFIRGNGGDDSRQIRFNITYNFGSNEIKKPRNRDTGIEDEKGRI